MSFNRRRFIAGTSTVLGSALSGFGLGAEEARDGRSPITKAEQAAIARSRATGERFTCIRTPESIDGPYYYEQSLQRRDLTEGRPGLPLRLGISIGNIMGAGGDCGALRGAVVDVWLADATGMYSNVGNDMQNENTVEKTFLRGHQITDEAGYVEFDAVVPGWEVVASAVPPITAIRRTPHIHVKVFHEHKVVTTQLYFEDDFMDRLYAEVEPYMSNRTMTVPGLSGSYARLRNVDDNAFHFDQSTPMAVQAEGEGIFASAIIGVATLGTRGFLPFKR